MFPNSTAQSLPFSFVTANDALVTVPNNWDSVPGIIGFRGDSIAGSSGATDPQTVLVADDPGVVNVNVNPTSPDTFATGGVAEFNTAVGSTNQQLRTIYALNGSGTARAPYLRFHFTTAGNSNLSFSYTAVDLDGSADNAISRVAVHYRTASSGTWTNLPDGFIADATAGPSASGLRTTRTFNLPAAADNQAILQIRIMTTDAAGSDEWIGIENVSLTGTTGAIPPSGTGSASPSAVELNSSSLLSVNVVPGTNAVASVVANLSTIGGSPTQAFTNQGGNLWTFNAAATGTTGQKSLPVVITDTAGLTGNTAIALLVTGPPLPISAIQGNGNVSPRIGETVTTSGVVTLIRLGRFYIQTPDALVDSDPATSEGLLIQSTTALPATVQVGNIVSVTGTVDEYKPDNNNLTVTRILNPLNLTQVSAGNPLPAPVVLNSTSFAPNGGLFQLERFEGMRAALPSLTVTSPTRGEFVSQASATGQDLTLNGILYGVPTSTARPFREPGIAASTSPVPNCDSAPCSIPPFDTNPEILRVDTFRLDQPNLGLTATANATVTNLAGVLTYENRYYTLLTDNSTTATVSGNISATPAPAPTAGEITVAVWNMENFTAAATDLAKASLAIRNFLRLPDILATIEMNSPTALATLASTVNNDAVTAGLPNPNYQTRIVTPPNPGSQNIGFLVKGDVTIVSATQQLSARTFQNPIDLTSNITFDRPPLVLEATATRAGKTVAFTVIGNHLLSLLDIDNESPSGFATVAARRRAKRKDQAEAMQQYLQQRLTANPNEQIFMVGDFNAFEVNDGYVDVINGIRGVPAAPGQAVVTVADLLSATTLSNMLSEVPANQRYSFTFQGSAQTLDHILYTPNLQPRLSRAAFARVAADFPIQFEADANRVERMSDHDAALFYLLAAEPLNSGIAFTRFGSVFNPITQRSVTNLQITNNTGAALSAPWQIVVPDPAANVTLANATGSNLQGKYITVNTPLAAGASTTVQLQFSNPSRLGFVYNPRFYSGAF